MRRPSPRHIAALTGAFSLVLASCGGGSPAPGAYAPPEGQVAEVRNEANQDLNRRIELAAAREAATNEAESFYRIGPDDQIDVQVFGAPAFSGVRRVTERGEISMPLLGPVQAAGLTPRELETALQERLGEKYMRDPSVTVSVAEMQSRGISVMGSVVTPGVYQVTGRKTLLEVLALAGGLDETAGSQVLVVHQAARATPPAPSAATAVAAGPKPPAPQGPGSGAAAGAAPGEADLPTGEVTEVNLTALLASGQTSLFVQPGDVIQVPPAGLVYVVGEVNRPGGFTIAGGEPISVLQAVALAEGLGNTAAGSRSVIVRRLDDGTKQEIPVDIEAVLEGEEPPPLLEASDVLFVPNNQAKSFALGVVGALVSMVTFRGLIY